MKTLSDPKTDRSATIMNDGYVIFSRMDGSEHVPSFRKPGRHYKTVKGAERAARRWIRDGK